MIGELLDLDDIRVPYPGLRKITERTQPRFAADTDEDEVFEEAKDSENAMLEGDRSSQDQDEQFDEFDEDEEAGAATDEELRVAQLLDEEEEDPGAPLANELIVTSIYNDGGYLTERTQIEGGVVTQCERFVYNARNQIERKVIEDPVNENIELEERQYLPNGRILRRTVTYSDKSQVVTDHRWSEDGRDEEEITRSDDGIESHYIRRYNEAGQIIEEIEVDPQTGEKVTEYTTYDPQGHMLEIGHVIDGARVPLLQYSYDSDGHETLCVAFDEGGKTLSTCHSAFESGDCVQQRTVTPMDEEVCTNEFDDSHHLLRAFTESNDEQHETVIEYDKAGRRVMQASRRLVGMNNARYPAYVRSSTTWYEYA